MATKTAGQRAKDMPAGSFATLCKVKLIGGLQLRKGAAAAVSCYWCYSIGASSERVLIGRYDSAFDASHRHEAQPMRRDATALGTAEVITPAALLPDSKAARQSLMPGGGISWRRSTLRRPAPPARRGFGS